MAETDLRATAVAVLKKMWDSTDYQYSDEFAVDLGIVSAALAAVQQETKAPLEKLVEKYRMQAMVAGQYSVDTGDSYSAGVAEVCSNIVTQLSAFITDGAQSAPKAPRPEATRSRSPHYSGKDSLVFWEEVRRRDDRTLYLMGCALQDIEGRMLQALGDPPGGLVDHLQGAKNDRVF